MSREVLILVDALAREKNVDREIVFQSLESALASASKKRFHNDVDVVVRIDRDSGDHDEFRRWQVVEPEEFEKTMNMGLPMYEGTNKVGDFIRYLRSIAQEVMDKSGRFL